MRLSLVKTLSKLKWVCVVAVMSLIVFAGMVSWVNSRNEKVSQHMGDMMYDALMNEISDDEMIKILNDVAKIDESSYQYLAKFKLASMYGEDKTEEAQSIYADLAADKRLTPELRELAEYLEVITLLKGNNLDLLKNKVQQFLSKRSEVYTSSIKEAIAVSMLKNNDISGAVGVIKEIVVSADSEPIVYKNAMDLLQIYEN
ncbi:hypothetical protein [Ehrlichia canis]|uniref:Uncharacterized protein n=1 Tax=Ehrlichia canis (strain Jake) TaxID=269484 RepID=A0ACA6AVE8_EHRCJ|nr:hypothetical protein [Ehrlichia canis]AAZ68285.1 conserved hypothetical protein [Ehrlichia canis str. Jake]AUO54953.1 hypothetical protein C1I72_03700 [Ehrlichia canis]UKC53584.1 hypothetical protein s20019040002_000627 [Ehrlichia canis]UKC54522.1 hypothetical protein s20026770001_000628 [Ehrlichia canis]UKC55458.1 hypothetical protein s21009500007_000628 [Ehrlichia canis]